MFNIKQDKPEEKPVKKGTRSWEPWKTLQVVKKDPGSRLRWVNTDPANLEKKQAEGWEFVRNDAEHDRAPGVEYGKGLGSVKQYRDLVLMKMPEELAESRNAYYREKTAQQSSGITKRLKDKMGQGGAAKVIGSVEINGQRID